MGETLAARAAAWAQVTEAPEGDRQRVYDEVYVPTALAVMREAGRPVDVLVLTAGTQPYSMAMSLCFRRPTRRVVFIHTEESLRHARRAVQLAGVDTELVRERQVAKADSVGVYRHIREVYDEVGDATVTVDFTSGSKAMVGGASAMAGLLGLEQVYVESTAPAVKGATGPLFGLEQAHVVDHPLVVLGDTLREEGERAWQDGQFDRAGQNFARLRDAGVPGYHWAARAWLAEAYARWDRLDFKLAVRPLDQAAASLRSAVRSNFAGDHALLDQQHIVAAQAQASRSLQEAVGNKSSATTDPAQAAALLRYLLGRATHEGPDVRALLAYRALELCVQRRLATHGIDADAPRWPDPPGDLLERYNAVAEPDHRISALPRTVALKQGWTLLVALQDAVVGALPRTAIDHSQKRNRSIYAHGTERLAADVADRFLAAVVSVAQAVAAADGQAFSWPDPAFLPVTLTPGGRA